MGLTIADGPLAPNASPSTNYAIDGPPHRLFFSAFPRRIRAEVAGKVVLETDGGMLLHETALLPQLYVPVEDIDESLLEPTDHTTHCPFKGDATYHTINVDDTKRKNGVWTYAEPLDAVPWLNGYRAMYWRAADAWFDEDQQVFGHLRDPFHRVDARPTRRHVTVTLDGRILAESKAPMVVSETGLPNRWYLAADDLRVELASSETATVCPYKGDASYGSIADVADVAWCYADPLFDARPIAGRWAFDDSKVTIAVDDG